MSNINTSRRHFLKQGGSAAAVWTGMPLVANFTLMGEAHAAADNYRALICIYLGGGNDSYNTIWLDEAASTARMDAVRPTLVPRPVGDTTSTYATTGLTITAQGKNYRLHHALQNIKTLFNAGDLNFVGGVGTLESITDRNNYATTARPRKLYSHNDQTAIWQTGEPDAGLSEVERAAEGVPVSLRKQPPQGWAGQMLGSLSGLNAYSAVGMEQKPPLLNCSAYPEAGISAVGSFGLGREGVIPLNQVYDHPDWGFIGGFKLSALEPVWQNTYRATGTTTHEFENAYNAVVAKAHLAWQTLSGPLSGAAVLAEKPADDQSFLMQLWSIARMIVAQQGTTPLPTRQVFFITLPGFDTHDEQVKRQRELLTQLDTGLDYLKRALGDTNWSKVVAFTTSEFGRKLNPNGNGCDHGWAGHHIVAGGGIAGGKVLGHIPSLADTNGTFNDPKLLADGTLIPTIPVEQYASYVSQWLGVKPGAISAIFPQLNSLTTTGYDLGSLI